MEVFPLTNTNAARALIGRGHNHFPAGELQPDELLPASFARFHGDTGIDIQMNWASGRRDGWVMIDVPGMESGEYQRIKEMFYAKAG